MRLTEPMRVEWTTPNLPKQQAARRSADQAMRDPNSDIKAALMLARDQEEKAAVIERAFPDLGAFDRHFGTMLALEYVPEQYGYAINHSTDMAHSKRLREAKWVALVATEHGMREMDPATLRVLWAMAPGDRVCGTVTGNEILEGGKIDRQWAEDVAEAVIQIRDRDGRSR